MNKIVFGILAVVASFMLAESLNCNTCSMGITGLCLFGTNTTCSTSEPNCYSGQAVFNISSIMSLKHKGCLATNLCNTTSTSSILGVSDTISQTCCSTDLCNGAGSIQLPLTVALGAALVAIWSTLA